MQTISIKAKTFYKTVMRNSFIYLALVFFCCESTFAQTKILYGTIVFTKSAGDTIAAKHTTDSIFKELLVSFDKSAAENEQADSMTTAALKSILSTELTSIKADFGPQKVTVDFSKDTIWQYSNDNVIEGDYYRIDYRTGKSWLYNKNPQMPIREGFAFIGLYQSDSIIINKKDRKTILGFDCYKVRYEIVPKKEEDTEIDEGNIICEMYVTDKIGLPVHALVPTQRLLDQFFPLEVIKRYTKLKGIEEHYIATELKTDNQRK